MDALTVWAIGAAICGLFAAWVAGVKGRSMGEGLILGLLFGPLGVLVEAMLPSPAPPAPRPRQGPARWEKPLREVEDQMPPSRPDAGPPRVR